MRTRAWIVPLALLAFVASRSFGQGLSLDTVYRLLLKVASAPTQVDYSGTVRTAAVGKAGTHVVVVHIDHKTNGSDRVKVIEPAREAGRVFVRSSSDHEHGHRANEPLSLGLSGVKSRLRSDLGLLLSNYHLSAGDGKPVAGRSTYRIDIVPKYPGRKSKQLWVDRATGVVLKSIINHPVGGVVVTTQFTHIQLSPQSWSLPSSTHHSLVLNKQEGPRLSNGTRWIGVLDKSELATLKGLEKKEHFPLLAPAYLPKGFVMEEVRAFPSPTDPKATVVHILYSDGLSSISLFLQQEEPFWPDRVRRFFFGDHHDGAHHHPEERGVAVVEGTESGTRYVLVSDIATETLKRMANSLSAVNR